jgi:hypothetical protein
MCHVYECAHAGGGERKGGWGEGEAGGTDTIVAVVML